MAYTLTLTREERKAIDWIGARYTNGNDLYRLLWVESESQPDDFDWDAHAELTFVVPEHIAWRIMENAEIDDGWPCFGAELAAKMQAFIDGIV